MKTGSTKTLYSTHARGKGRRKLKSSGMVLCVVECTEKEVLDITHNSLRLQSAQIRNNPCQEKYIMQLDFAIEQVPCD
jgi:hypothetical protein